MSEKKTHGPDSRVDLANPAFGGVMKAMYALEGPLQN